MAKNYDTWLSTPPDECEEPPNAWHLAQCPAGHTIYTNVPVLTRGSCYVCVIEAAKERAA